MPTYEYECKKCGYNFEAFQSMSDEPLKICDKCGGDVRRLILGGAGVIFKGSGFYVTDKVADKVADKSSGKSKTPSAAKTKTTESASDTASGTAQSTSSTVGDTPKTETKPAAKTA
jgi:putative FmdB family regulatory protein